MAYITLNQAKNHCNIDLDFYDDDNYILGLIDTAEVSLAFRINDDLANHVTAGVLALPLQRGIKFLVGQWYEYREPVVIGTIVAQMPYTLDDIITDYINHTIK